MDEIPPQLDANNNLYLTHSLLPSPMDQPREESQTASNIDWVSFFSDLMEVGDQKSSPSPIVSISARNEHKNKGKVSKNKKAIIPPRIAFHTRSADDILDDGYRWRKYGQKSVKNNVHPRSYYRCTYHTCNVKKQIQRLSKDSSIVVTTYDGIHNHPCEKLMECLSPLLKQLQFLSSI